MKAKDNPFRVERLHQLEYSFGNSELEWQNLLCRLRDLQWRGAILGPHGAGKTTLMTQIQQRIEQLGIETSHLRLREDDLPCLKSMLKEWLAQSVSSQVLMLDSAGLLNFWNWQWLRLKTRHHAGIVITSHRAGRLPTLIRCETSPELLESLVNQLTAEQNCSEMVDVAKLHSLFHTFRQHT